MGARMVEYPRLRGLTHRVPYNHRVCAPVSGSRRTPMSMRRPGRG